jgi:glycosyltransferase involved in cell wall biosynthesis
MKKLTLSIHTATYNRGYLIEQAYQSLLNQSCHDFEWIVVDDGSDDNTEELFRKWIQANNSFPIIYHKQENAGVCRARNKGLELASGDYFFILDSDDYLTSDAIEKLHKWILEIDNIDELVGVGALRGDINGRPLKGSYPSISKEIGYVDASNLERSTYNMDVDMCEAYKTSILRRFPFPVWLGEKFAPESLVMNELALQGFKLRWHPEVIYICEYQDVGLTKGAWNLERCNPMGYAMLANHSLKYLQSFKSRFQAAARHIALSIVGKGYGYIFQSNAPLLTLLVFPYGLALSLRKKYQYRSDMPPQQN